MSRRRTKPVDYAGAQGRIEPLAARRLDPKRWAVQKKIDGALVRVHLDGRGRIARMFTRSGEEVSRKMAGPLLGALVGWPESEIVGEITAFTEAGRRETERFGAPRVFLFDCIRAGRAYVAAQPYRVRRDHLYKMQTWAIDEAPQRPWERDGDGRAHDRTSGRFVRAIPAKAYELAPIVDQRPASRFDEAWDEVEREDAEGVVLVNLDAPMGRTRSKLKCKRMQTFDATVVRADLPQLVQPLATTSTTSPTRSSPARTQYCHHARPP